MAAYRRVYDSRHLQADCQEPGSAPEPYARQSRMGNLYVLHSNGYLGVLPTKWRRKTVGIDMRQNYVTVTL